MSDLNTTESTGTVPSLYMFARWDRREPPACDQIARPQDLKYFLRVAHCGNGITIPLPVRTPERRTLAHLRVIVAFMESDECSQLRLPLKVWRLVRDYLFTFHAFWTDRRTEVSATRQDVCALIIHTTPYKRLSPIPNATRELIDIMSYAKTFMPWDVYRAPYVTAGHARLAADRICGEPTCYSRAVVANVDSKGMGQDDTEGAPQALSTMPEGLDDRPGSRLHQLRDARERFDIRVDTASLPQLPPVAAALGHGRPPIGELTVWMYARVDPARARDGGMLCHEDLAYFVRINKLPRRINIPLYVHGFDTRSGHILQTLLAVLHEQYVVEMELPPPLYTAVKKLLLVMLAAWSEYPGFPEQSYREMNAAIVARTPYQRTSGPADHREILTDIVDKAALAWSGYHARQLTSPKPTGGLLADALREYIGGRVMINRGIQVGDDAAHEVSERFWEVPNPEVPRPRPLFGVFGSVVDILDDPREDLHLALVAGPIV
ncbi:hypothetical protein OH76DRAFT_1490903 [Lentinus brumalis]|uniref:Uncharacterized protein n=1 Tax=Lentinus brumalis TaxID=2498619 RepID=A0A371CHE6_9APHY|nr:hypothetical protein OH76DRAFT_1490903 [Polyporus brumalis]